MAKLIMIKTGEITQKQLDILRKTNNQVSYFKKLVGIEPGDKIKRGVGDTCIQITDAKKLGIYKLNFKSKDFYYIIAEVLDERMAFAYSLYIRS